MKQKIINNLANPRQLEELYRDNKATFKSAFNTIYPEIETNEIAQIWNERLNFKSKEISWGTRRELAFVIIASIIAGLIAKIPVFTTIEAEYFYTRNIALIVFPLLTAYFLWRQKQDVTKHIFSAVAILLSALYINLLPNNPNSDTLILACIHLPLFLWAVLGFSFAGDHLNNYHKRLDFLRYNADLLVMTTIILIAGGLFTAVTLGLFTVIDIPLKEYYLQYVGIWGLAAAPIVGTYLVQTNPQLVNKVSPVIAKVFTPLVFMMLILYLLAIISTGKDPYNDRAFLFIFNILLIGVMAIILFSIAETSKNSESKIGAWLLLGLAIVTVAVNGIALSAILFRISEWGITPNRIAILGGNLLILTNLLIVTVQLFKTTKYSNETEKVAKSIATFLPIYCIWTMVVTFLFPIIFNFQ
ncbi:MAG: hypothetical protein HQ474_05205 [Flammeovirgaceae bacterium]|nr:hypothetical protein [Flammeovirgaceae bacterium]NQW27289.1 hypothetical protein [Flammeovirgaceae bacterium]